MLAEHLVLVEDYMRDFDFKGKLVIPFNPNAAYSLSKNSIAYSCLDEFYSESELTSRQRDYFFHQLKWYEDFDHFMQSNISLCAQYSIPMAKSNYLRLKYFVDTFVANSFIFFSLFEKNNALRNITYLHRPYIEGSKPTIFEFFYNSRRPFSHHLKLITQNCGIPMEEVVFSDPEPILSHSLLEQPSDYNPIKSLAKKSLNFFKYKKYRKFGTHSGSLKDKSFLFMHAGSIDTDHAIGELIGSGSKVYVEEKKRFLREDLCGRSSVILPGGDSSLLDSLKKECLECAQNLKSDSPIISWINDRTSIDISSVALPYLKRFISEDSYYMLSKAMRVYRFYKDKDIDYLFTRGNTDRDSQGTIIAAKYMKAAKSVCLQHACSATDTEETVVYDTETYDYLLSRDSIAQKYFKKSIRNDYTSDCIPIQMPYYLQNISEKAPIDSDPQTVIYVERKFSDRVRTLNENFHAFDSYFDLQKEIIDYFGQRKDFTFIYKHAPCQAWSENSTLKYIGDKGYSNIRVFSKHLIDSLRLGKRVIVDYATGPLFESVASKKSVLCIQPSYFRISDHSKDVFGKILRDFETADEAIEIIRDFLDSDPKEYMRDLSLEGLSFIDAVNDIIDNHNKP
ncbi:hypothetical protein ACFL0T_07650 [Candidatus Omnitrophota bacterium]